MHILIGLTYTFKLKISSACSTQKILPTSLQNLSKFNPMVMKILIKASQMHQGPQCFICYHMLSSSSPMSYYPVANKHRGLRKLMKVYNNNFNATTTFKC